MKPCKYCGISLTEENCYPSDWNRGGYICKNCRGRQYKKNVIPNKEKIYCKIKTLNIKQEVINEYGGKCECCGQDVWQFLTIDHSNNNGYQHRKTIGRSGGNPFYRWLKNIGYPKDGFRLLCYNCNCSIGYFGFCSHHYSLDYCNICGTSLDDIFSFFKEGNISICKKCTIDIAPKRKTAQNFEKKGRSLFQRRIDNKNLLLNIKLKLIKGYGEKCACCGENNYMFLTIDHVNKDGYFDRLKKGYTQYKFYNEIIDNNFPKCYQLLCYNCNCSKGAYGKCYHDLCKEIGKENISIDEYKSIIKEE